MLIGQIQHQAIRLLLPELPLTRFRRLGLHLRSSEQAARPRLDLEPADQQRIGIDAEIAPQSGAEPVRDVLPFPELPVKDAEHGIHQRIFKLQQPGLLPPQDLVAAGGEQPLGSILPAGIGIRLLLRRGRQHDRDRPAFRVRGGGAVSKTWRQHHPAELRLQAGLRGHQLVGREHRLPRQAKVQAAVQHGEGQRRLAAMPEVPRPRCKHKFAIGFLLSAGGIDHSPAVAHRLKQRRPVLRRYGPVITPGRRPILLGSRDKLYLFVEKDAVILSQQQRHTLRRLVHSFKRHEQAHHRREDDFYPPGHDTLASAFLSLYNRDRRQDRGQDHGQQNHRPGKPHQHVLSHHLDRLPHRPGAILIVNRKVRSRTRAKAGGGQASRERSGPPAGGHTTCHYEPGATKVGVGMVK